MKSSPLSRYKDDYLRKIRDNCHPFLATRLNSKTSTISFTLNAPLLLHSLTRVSSGKTQ